MKPPSSNQIGGKGSVRRKVKVVRNRNFTVRKTKEQLHFENMIKRINEYITNVGSEYQQVADVMVEDIVCDGFSDLQRYDTKSKEIFVEIKGDVTKFINNKLMNGNKFKGDTYTILGKYFIKDCIDCIVDIFNDIEIFLEKKKYVEEQVDEKEFTDKQCFEFLGLDISVTPTKQDVKKAFKNKSFEYHPDKHPEEIDKYTKLYQDISVSYKLILKRYKL
tara:strand:+ start:1267 stop:1923 length:657 start_codon:yes stop_codon:yes gene_type:complete